MKIIKPNKPTKSDLKPGVSKKVVHRKKEEGVTPAQKFGLHNLKAPKGAHKHRKILGRGPGSGHGKTSTRGSKGQTSRAGRHFYLGFEGGQTPLIRRIPKRGFTNKFKKKYQILNLNDLNRIKESTITPELLEAKGIIKDKAKLIKVLGDGEIKNPMSVQAHGFSKRASEAIKNAGGKTEIISEATT